MINISLNNIDINMGKITPNRIAFVILPEEVTLVLYLLYILLGAREHIIHTYIHSNNFARDSRQQYLFMHKCNFTLLCSGWFVWPEAKKLSWENAKRWEFFFARFRSSFPTLAKQTARYADKAFLISCCCSIKKYLKPRTWIIK